MKATMLIDPLNNMRHQHELDTIDPFEDEEMAVDFRLPLPVMSIFRPLAINYLWMRSEELKDAGQYFDALHLSRFICELQPNIDSVWQFLAWNMSYNISVGVPTPAERWRWVQAGYELVRDEGLPANPDSGLLYWQIAWIFQHKMGANQDNFHRYYKWRLAYDMSLLLTKGTNAELEAMIALPLRWDELAVDPEIARFDAMFAEIVKNDSEGKTYEDLLRNISNNLGAFPQPFQDYLKTANGWKAYETVDLFKRTKQLRDVWRLDPERMLMLNQKYGPRDYDTGEKISLNWQHPAAHAIFWASIGLELESVQLIEYNQLIRVIYQSLQQLFHYGKITMYTDEVPMDYIYREKGQDNVDEYIFNDVPVFVSQDLRMFPIAYQAVMMVLDQRIAEGGQYETFQGASINMLIAGINHLYFSGYQKQAAYYLGWGKKRYPQNENFHAPSLEAFIQKFLKRDIEDKLLSTRDARNYIEGTFKNAFRFYAYNDDENYSIQMQFATKLRKLYDQEYSRVDEQPRMQFPPVKEMIREALKSMLIDRTVKNGTKNLLMQRLEIDQPKLYDELKAFLVEYEQKEAQKKEPEKQESGT